MSDEQLEALILWAPNAITERQFWAVLERAEARFPDIYPAKLMSALAAIYNMDL